MKRLSVLPIVFFLGLLLLSWSHKFYVGIFQIEHNHSRERLEVTCRIFADDLDQALEKKYKSKFHFADARTDAQELDKFRSYLSEKFQITIDQKLLKPEFKSAEFENGVMVSYWVIPSVKSLKKISVRNIVLFDFVTTQQNIIQIKAANQKQSLLLTADDPEGSVVF